MLFQTILNRVSKFKSFIFEAVSFSKNGKTIEVLVKARKNGQVLCGQCKNSCSVYDTSTIPRRFQFIPIYNIPVFFIYYVRRVNCPVCGVKTEYIPWACGKRPLTTSFMKYLANWSRHLSWKDVGLRFGVSWDCVFMSVKWIVDYGLKYRNLEEITAIGVDEVLWKRNHKYLTLVYEISKDKTRRLLWIGEERTKESFAKFFDLLGDKSKEIQFVCSDMWKAYLQVIKERAGQAIHVLDRFHIVANLNKALDRVRAGEYKRMEKEGYEPVLKKSRWPLLKKPQNLKDYEKTKLKDLMKFNLQTMRCYLLKEEFQQLWEYVSAGWAGKFIDAWTKKVMLSKIEPLKKEAKTIRKHKPLILNYFKAKKEFSSGVVEGLNNKVKLTFRKSYGFRTFDVLKVALFHNLGNLPEPPDEHKFF